MNTRGTPLGKIDIWLVLSKEANLTLIISDDVKKECLMSNIAEMCLH